MNETAVRKGRRFFVSAVDPAGAYPAMRSNLSTAASIKSQA